MKAPLLNPLDCCSTCFVVFPCVLFLLYLNIARTIMMHINVETMTVTTPVYTMFIILSFAVCPADCGVTDD